MFRVASSNIIDIYADSVSEFIRKCIDVVPTVTIKTYPNQKLWIDGGICAKLKARTTAVNHGKANMAEYKQYSYSLHNAIKQATCEYRNKVEGLHMITGYKTKTSHVMDTDILLPDKLNTFFDLL